MRVCACGSKTDFQRSEAEEHTNPVQCCPAIFWSLYNADDRSIFTHLTFCLSHSLFSLIFSFYPILPVLIPESGLLSRLITTVHSRGREGGQRTIQPCTPRNTPTHTCTQARTHTHTCIHTHVHAHAHAYSRVHHFTDMHKHTHTHTNTHVHSLRPFNVVHRKKLNLPFNTPTQSSGLHRSEEHTSELQSR